MHYNTQQYQVSRNKWNIKAVVAFGSVFEIECGISYRERFQTSVLQSIKERGQTDKKNVDFDDTNDATFDR